MEEIYFISFAWKNRQESISFGNGVIEEFPLEWLKKMQDSQAPDRAIRLLWWRQLTEEEKNAAKGIGLTAI